MASPMAQPLTSSCDTDVASLVARAVAAVRAFVATFLPGAVQGAATVLLGHPLDTAKTRMQASGPNAISSALGTVVNIARREGLCSLFRGCTPPLLMEGAKRSLQFALWDLFRDTHSLSVHEGGPPSSDRGSSGVRRWGNVALSTIGSSPFFSGAVAGGIGTTIGCPMHVIKIQTQYATREGTRNAWTCALGIMRREGPRGFYRGYKYNLLKDVCFAGTYLGIYGRFQERWASQPSGASSSGSRAFLAGATASVTTWTLLYPLDTVKTLVQAGQHQHLTAQLFRTPRRLYRGLVASLLKAGPVSGVSMCCYELAKARMDAWRATW